MRRLIVLVGTRKGLFVLSSDEGRREWSIEGPRFLGHIVHHAVVDPRDGRTIVAAVRAGHLGPTVYRSEDLGAHWEESKAPPAFAKREGGQTVSHVFWLTPGAASEPGRWYAGTSPQGLFVSDDGGRHWRGVDGFNEHPDRIAWIGGLQEAPPDGGTLHSINLDPRNPAHQYIGMSAGGAFESRDAGKTWKPMNRGCAADFLPDPDPEYGHDVHCMRVHPATGEIYQQNHCGIYRYDLGAKRWDRIGRNMPKEIGDVGFPMVLHPRDPSTLWVFPMDGGTVWPRMPIGGKPAVYGSNDAGRSWQRMDAGLPREQGWFTVKRQAMTADPLSPAGLYFGTTGGEVWASGDEGRNWSCIRAHLPHIYSMESALVA
jgi:photosystem II stability/assembly factor-like uncharacterized protein